MEITNITLRSEKIVNPIKLVLASDLHDEDGTTAWKMIKGIGPDLILMPGDIFDHDVGRSDSPQSHSFLFLQRMSNVAPSFLSIGNHEGIITPKERKKFDEAGVHLLDDQAEKIFINKNYLWIGGLSSPCCRDHYYSRWHTQMPNLFFLNSFAENNGFKLLLSHHPEFYRPYISSLDVDLTLSGHAHGGQFRLFGRGLFSPGQGIFPKYTSGIYDDRLVVSRGLGNKTKLPRIFNPYNLVVIHLLPQ